MFRPVAIITMLVSERGKGGGGGGGGEKERVSVS